VEARIVLQSRHNELNYHSFNHCNRLVRGLAQFRRWPLRASRSRPARFHAILGAVAALLAIGVHLFPLTAGGAVSVSVDIVIVAVTGLIAGWLGSTVLLLFLTVVTFLTAETFGVALLSTGRNIAVAIFCGIAVAATRRVVTVFRERERLLTRVVIQRRRLVAVRSHVGRLRRAVHIRERALRASGQEVSAALSGHQAVLAELSQARLLVDAAQRSSGHFVAMMSHEIRTPLHGLMATIDMLRDEPLSPEGRHRVSIARVSARTLLNIANDILDLSRIDAGAFPLEHRPFDLPSVIREVVDEARARAQSLGLDLRATTEGPLPRSFIGDPARIKQILANLVSNALKFTSAGGVSVQARYDGRRCVIDVIDSGEGILEDKRDVIFEPYVQVESKVSRRAGGAGLGLPISRRLSQAMGGTLILVNTGPQGSTFRVSLPLLPSEEEPLEDQSQSVLKNPPGRILVVEDHPANQYVARSLLESLECTVGVAGSGPEALDLLTHETFDLVLMDCQMPGMDGYETTRRMRAILHRYVPVIAITANAMVDDKQRCLDAGMDDFLPKPFNRSALSDLLSKWLVPGAGSLEDGESEPPRITQLPVLSAPVFDELWQSLQWRTAPLKKIYESFLSVAHETLDCLPAHAASRSVLARRVHTLVGSAGMVGARQVERLAVWLQEVIKSERRAEIETGRVLLAESMRRFEAELQHRLNSLRR
jgi:two-component system, sensor histidine kinase